MCGDEIPYSCQLSTVNFVLTCSFIQLPGSGKEEMIVRVCLQLIKLYLSSMNL